MSFPISYYSFILFHLGLDSDSVLVSLLSGTGNGVSSNGKWDGNGNRGFSRVRLCYVQLSLVQLRSVSFDLVDLVWFGLVWEGLVRIGLVRMASAALVTSTYIHI